MPTFEYKVLTYNNRDTYNTDRLLESKLVKLGEQGWELVSALPVVNGSGSEGEISVYTDDIKFIFKKEN
ncbi:MULTISPECIES: DUF4177 domain-containing protein [unclassified Peribacillus]|uniref:DUF4177 domain-containing protein n=1 Tax=unclassified Peribacillus TaxID=2675266 RepID=UPI00191464D9|nr:MULTISPECIES: DUF4177 domain-containing protein [unclassified Peribacillus]MBK5446084.1 DUF4177 domain-containing protein [Peribacillus sp. TH24]MBK5497392.1 DUF4177 domain-containing protein [Peribacillus sp. TH14]WMX57467.1 DUF4177 domain-containing protein [Peribacillus sp. R9-11]